MPVEMVQTNLNGLFQLAGGILVPFLAVQSASGNVPNLGSYTPDLRVALEHNITVTGAAWTLNAPILPPQLIAGWTPVLILHIRNASGGVIATTFNAVYHQPAWVEPTNGNGNISIMHFDQTAGVWYNTSRQAQVPT